MGERKMLDEEDVVDIPYYVWYSPAIISRHMVTSGFGYDQGAFLEGTLSIWVKITFNSALAHVSSVPLSSSSAIASSVSLLLSQGI